MGKTRKIVFGGLIGLLAVFSLLAAALLLLPKVIDPDWLKDKIRSEVSRRAGGDVDFDGLTLALIPVPYLIVDNLSWHLPQKVAGSAETVTVYPAILPLLSGKIGIRELRVRQPDVTITLQKSPEEKAPSDVPDAGDVMRQVLLVAGALPALRVPVVDSYVEDGRIRLMYDNASALDLQHLEARLTQASGRVEVQAACASDKADGVSLSGAVDPRQSKGNARIRLTGLRPQVIRDALGPDVDLKIQAAPVDLALDVYIDGPERIRADLDVVIPQLSLARGERILEIRNRGLKGRIDLDRNSATVSLAELVLDHPPMRVAGQLTSAAAAAQLDLQIEGRDIDVKATRQAALAFAGENNAVRGIFAVLKGGTVPQITLTARGTSLNGLADMEALVIRGQMRAGDIAIPGVQLDLTDTDGDVVISGGILEGKNLRTRLGNSIGHNGTLTLGLAGDDAPFHLDIDVRADLAQLPPILGRLIDDKDLRSELAKIKDLKGSANGKLVLGEKLGKVSVTVAAADIRLSARYGGIEEPVTITGGNFSHAGTRIAIGQLDGSLGKSTFSGLSGGFDWGKADELEIASGRGSLYLAEVVPWLAAVDALRETSTYYGGEKGVITISAISFKGPLQTPRDWHFDLRGEVEDLVLKDLPGQPGPLTIAALRFKADPGELTYTDGRFSLLDATVRMSGTHRDYRTGLDQDLSLTLEGRLGPEFTAWSAGLLGMPDWLKLRPLSLSPSRIRYVRNGKNTLSAAVVTQDGLEMSTDMLIGRDELIARKLLIQDNLSRAAIGFQVKDSAVELSFAGELYRQTLDRLFSENTLVTGSITGEGRARWDSRCLSRIGLQGELRGRDIFLAYDPAAPLQIHSLDLRGDMSKIWIDAADVNWGGMPLKLSGRLQPESENRLGLELDIAADTVDLDHLIQVLQSDPGNEEPDSDPGPGPFAVIGTVRFAADRLTFGGFTWRPVHADVRLNGEHTGITIKQALVCGISTPGTLSLSPETIRFDIEPTATDQDINASLNCLAAAESAIKGTVVESIKSYKADGTYSLQGRLQGSGKPQDLLKTATGQLRYSAVDGHIYKSIVLLNVLKYLNATELFTGRTDLADMEKKGFGYRTMKIEADLSNGKASFNRITLDGAAMALTATGEHDLMTGRLDLTLLVSLQITLDRIFGKIPLVGGALQTLTAVPLAVRGRLNDIRVYPLAPAAISYQLKSLMEQTAKRPIRLIPNGQKPAAEGSAAP